MDLANGRDFSDPLSPAERSYRMSLIKSKNTKPEILVRKIVFSLGYRYRIHYTKLPGKPDICFLKKRKVIFINGCFWHGHNCINGKKPKSNIEYWNKKIESNKDRDEKNKLFLSNLGYQFLEIWECELKDKNIVREKIINFLK